MLPDQQMSETVEHVRSAQWMTNLLGRYEKGSSRLSDSEKRMTTGHGARHRFVRFDSRSKRTTP